MLREVKPMPWHPWCRLAWFAVVDLRPEGLSRMPMWAYTLRTELDSTKGLSHAWRGKDPSTAVSAASTFLPYQSCLSTLGSQLVLEERILTKVHQLQERDTN